MGTRHIICVFWQGKWFVAQYGPWDGYPDGQGIDILKFLSIPINIENLKAGLQHCVYILTPEDHKLFPAERNNGEESLKPTLCAKILDVIANAGAKVLETMKNDPDYDADESDKLLLEHELEFVLDTLFCEWAYVIDLDLEVLEVFASRHSQRKTETHRFRDVGDPRRPVPGLIVSFDFAVLPALTEKEFTKRCRRHGDEEEEEEEEDPEEDSEEDLEV